MRKLLLVCGKRDVNRGGRAAAVRGRGERCVELGWDCGAVAAANRKGAAVGAANEGLIAVAGDWNADGIDTIGLYNRSAGAFFLRNSNSAGPGDHAFFYGPPGTDHLLPLAADAQAIPPWQALAGEGGQVVVAGLPAGASAEAG